MPEPEGMTSRGLSRRDLLKRGAVVGGLMWTAPVIQSIRTPAYAQPYPIRTCCQCVTGGDTNEPCESNGFTCESCVRFCEGKGGVLKYAVGEGCSCILGVCRGFENLPCEQQLCG